MAAPTREQIIERLKTYDDDRDARAIAAIMLEDDRRRIDLLAKLGEGMAKLTKAALALGD